MPGKPNDIRPERTARRRAALREALALARQHAAGEDRPQMWTQLERAHILAQPDAGLHTRVHAIMLVQAVTELDWREALGQLGRLPVAAPASWLAKYPVGNPGTTRINAFLSQPLPEDLRPYFEG